MLDQQKQNSEAKQWHDSVVLYDKIYAYEKRWAKVSILDTGRAEWMLINQKLIVMQNALEERLRRSLRLRKVKEAEAKAKAKAKNEAKAKAKAKEG